MGIRILLSCTIENDQNIHSIYSMCSKTHPVKRNHIKPITITYQTMQQHRQVWARQEDSLDRAGGLEDKAAPHTGHRMLVDIRPNLF